MGGDREAAGDDFIPYMATFFIGEGTGKLLKLLRGTKNREEERDGDERLHAMHLAII
jgi:hypothetical protein